jgi:hypothetical protein
VPARFRVAQSDIINACYIACANSTSSTPELKGCLEKASEQADTTS